MKFQIRFCESFGRNSLNITMFKLGNKIKYKKMLTTFVNTYSGKLFIRYEPRIERRMKTGDIYL